MILLKSFLATAALIGSVILMVYLSALASKAIFGDPSATGLIFGAGLSFLMLWGFFYVVFKGP